MITEQDGEYFLRCRIKNRLKIAKLEEVVRQLWSYRLLTEYGYPKERTHDEKVIYFASRVEPRAANIIVYHGEDKDHYLIALLVSVNS